MFFVPVIRSGTGGSTMGITCTTGNGQALISFQRFSISRCNGSIGWRPTFHDLSGRCYPFCFPISQGGKKNMSLAPSREYLEKVLVTAKYSQPDAEGARFF
jgi:hypothetical protein